jgi:hypothetical protein
MHAADKKLNEMNRLADMAHFPAIVNAGATVNILLTLCVTWWLVPHYPQIFAPMAWVAIVLCVNLLPVVLLRLTLRPDTVYPTLATMHFIRDQHKFSDWVYLAASANMAFWILLSWALFSISYLYSTALLEGMLVVAALATFSPVLLRSRRR